MSTGTWTCGKCIKSAPASSSYASPQDPNATCTACGARPPLGERLFASQQQNTALLKEILAALVASGPSATQPAVNQPETCDVEEAAALLHTTPDGVYALKARGMLPETIGPGRSLLWLRSDLLAYKRRASSSGRNRR